MKQTTYQVSNTKKKNHSSFSVKEEVLHTLGRERTQQASQKDPFRWSYVLHFESRTPNGIPQLLHHRCVLPYPVGFSNIWKIYGRQWCFFLSDKVMIFQRSISNEFLTSQNITSLGMEYYFHFCENAVSRAMTPIHSLSLALFYFFLFAYGSEMELSK